MKKLLVSFLIGLVLIFSCANYFVASAQTSTATTTTSSSTASTPTWYNQSFQEWYNKVYDTTNPSEIFGERYTAAQVQWVIYGLFGFLVNSVTGPQNTSTIQCFLTNSGDINTCVNGLKNMLSASSLPATGNFADQNVVQKEKPLASLVFSSDRPFSGISYVKERLQKLNPVTEVHAQTLGFGFNALQPIQNMWLVFRNIAFGLFVIIAIVFAFMIMFRVKISPQVVITVQSAIPKIIMALILVTFSYAIAGFLVDLMYVIIGLLSVLIAPIIPTVTILQPNTYKATDVFNLLTAGKTMDILSGVSIFNLIFTYLGPTILICLVLFAASLLLTGGAGAIISVIFLIILLIVIVVGLVISIKTLWMLLKAFANIILLTIFAPIQLTLGSVVPGLGFGQWLKSYASNLATFVVVGVLWLFAWIFSILAWQIFVTGGLTSPTGGLTNPISTNSSWPPLLGSSGFGMILIYTGVSFVFFTLIPKATEIIQGFISGKPFAYGSAIGEAFGPVTAGWNSGLARTAREFGNYSMLSNILNPSDTSKGWGKVLTNLKSRSPRISGMVDSIRGGAEHKLS